MGGGGWWSVPHYMPCANILKQLLISIETRLSSLSSHSKFFHEASKHYQNILNQFGYDYKLQYKLPNNENENECKSSKNKEKKYHLVQTAFFKEHLQQHQ